MSIPTLRRVHTEPAPGSEQKEMVEDLMVDRNRNQVPALAFEIGATLSIIDDRSSENRVLLAVDAAAKELARVMERLARLSGGHVLQPVVERVIEEHARGPEGDFHPKSDQIGRCKVPPQGEWRSVGLSWLLNELRKSGTGRAADDNAKFGFLTKVQAISNIGGAALALLDRADRARFQSVVKALEDVGLRGVAASYWLFESKVRGEGGKAFNAPEARKRSERVPTVLSDFMAKARQVAIPDNCALPGLDPSTSF